MAHCHSTSQLETWGKAGRRARPSLQHPGIASIDPGVGGMDALQEDSHRQTPGPDHLGLNLGSTTDWPVNLGQFIHPLHASVSLSVSWG